MNNTTGSDTTNMTYQLNNHFTKAQPLTGHVSTVRVEVGGFHEHFNIRIETKEPDYPSIIESIVRSVNKLTLDIVNTHQKEGMAMDPKAVRTRLMYGIGFWANVCGKGALDPGKGRGFKFTIGIDQNGISAPHEITVKRHALGSFIQHAKATDGRTITIYRVAAVTLDLYLRVATANDYKPSWLPENGSLDDLHKWCYTLSSPNLSPQYALSEGCCAVRDHFESFMKDKKSAYSRDIVLERRVCELAKAPQIVDLNMQPLEDLFVPKRSGAFRRFSVPTSSYVPSANTSSSSSSSSMGFGSFSSRPNVGGGFSSGVGRGPHIPSGTFSMFAPEKGTQLTLVTTESSNLEDTQANKRPRPETKEGDEVGSPNGGDQRRGGSDGGGDGEVGVGFEIDRNGSQSEETQGGMNQLDEDD